MSTTDTVGGFLHPGDNIIDTLQPDHEHGLAARVRELEAALQEIANKPVNVPGYNSAGAILLRLTAVRGIARRALKGGAA